MDGWFMVGAAAVGLGLGAERASRSTVAASAEARSAYQLVVVCPGVKPPRSRLGALLAFQSM